MTRNEAPVFDEVQTLMRSHWWLLLMIALPVVTVWYGFVQQIVLGRPFGNNPGPDWLMWVLAIVYGLGLPAFMAALQLRIRVDSAGIRVNYFPLFTRRIGFSELRTCRAVEYRPIRDYGGWGVRWSPGRGWAYSVSGSQGVLLEFMNGRSLMLGTQRSEELASFIRAFLAGGS